MLLVNMSSDKFSRYIKYLFNTGLILGDNSFDIYYFYDMVDKKYFSK